jgi:hypothetical protein
MRDLIGITYDGVSGGPELTAAEWRQVETGLFVRNTSDLVIGGVRGGAVTNSGFTATIAPLTAIVQPTAARGVYQAVFPAGAAELTKTINAAHATLPRVDAIDLKIYDHEADASGLRGADIVYTAGTAASSPTAPTFTGVGVRLGTFAVPASGGGNPAWTQDPALVGYAGTGGVLEVAQRPSNPRNGLEIFNRSTGVREIFITGLGWRNLLGPAWQTYNTIWSSPGGTLAINSGVKNAKWRDLGNRVDFKIYMQRAADTNLGDGAFSWSLPVALSDYDTDSGTGYYRRGASLGSPVPFTWIPTTSTTIGAFRNSDGARLGTGSFTAAVGDVWVLGGSYEKTQT